MNNLSRHWLRLALIAFLFLTACRQAGLTPETVESQDSPSAYLDPALPLGVMEINAYWSHASGGQTTPDSLAGAIWWADVLGRLIRHRVDYVAHFVLQTNAGLVEPILFEDVTTLALPAYSVTLFEIPAAETAVNPGR